MKFADFQVGQRIEVGPRVVTEEEILRFARSYDPQWFHIDPVAALGGPYGGLIASGFHTCGIAITLLAENILKGSESFGSPGLSYVKWPNPVRPGDALTLHATVLEARRSRQKPNLGVLRWRWQLWNQRGEEALDLEGTSVFQLD